MIVKKYDYVAPMVEIMNARVEKGFLGASDGQPVPGVDGDFTSRTSTGEGLGDGGTVGNEIFT